MQIFGAWEQQLHVSSGDQIAHATLAGTQSRLNPIQCVTLRNIPQEKSTSQKEDMWFLSPFGSSSIVIPKFFIWAREKRIGTLPVSSTSTLEEHGWCCRKMNNATFLTRFCFRVCKHKGLVAGTEFCFHTMIQRIFLEPSDCRSRSNWSCATKIQNNVRRMVGKIQRNWCKPCKVSWIVPRSSASASWTGGIIRAIGIPIDWFRGMNLPNFQRRKVLNVDRHLPCFSFLDQALTFVWVIITAWTLFWLSSARSNLPKVLIAFRRAFLASFFFGPPGTFFFWPQLWFQCCLLHQGTLFLFL